MPSMADLDYTDNFDANKQPFLSDLYAALDSMETYSNTLKDNFIQAATDSFGVGYALTDDGVPFFTTSTLYNKLTALDTDTSGDHTLAVVGAWTDVDTANAAVSVDPELVGDFNAIFQFNVEVVTSNATNEVRIRFRLNDGSAVSDFIAKFHSVTGVTGTTCTIPVNLSHKFSTWAVATQTVKLQYFLDALTNTTVKALASSNFPIAMRIEKV